MINIQWGPIICQPLSYMPLFIITFNPHSAPIKQLILPHFTVKNLRLSNLPSDTQIDSKDRIKARQLDTKDHNLNHCTEQTYFSLIPYKYKLAVAQCIKRDEDTEILTTIQAVDRFPLTEISLRQQPEVPKSPMFSEWQPCPQSYSGPKQTFSGSLMYLKNTGQFQLSQDKWLPLYPILQQQHPDLLHSGTGKCFWHLCKMENWSGEEAERRDKGRKKQCLCMYNTEGSWANERQHISTIETKTCFTNSVGLAKD